jgi:AhpD family alkylhydroperoxidase
MAATFGYVEYADASPEVKAVYDDIMATRGVDWVSNFWKAIAHDPGLLRRTWQTLKEIMRPDGALDPLTKEMMYLAVSASNQCHYCIASHTAAAWKAGMNDAMFGELMAIVGMANETNRLFPSPREVVEREVTDAVQIVVASDWVTVRHGAGGISMFRVVKGEIVESHRAAGSAA